ncbi:LacI family DNA-binding transcriptional regulator [Brenneria goodwinii]|uniref:LacI family DNA-binding transcriptional regulator n=1 Tax=Brenneria goodwinii TaxID=1109412 RepID=UPI0036E12110
MEPSKRINQADIARLAEVSVSTVSRALSGQVGMSAELRERIRRIADDLGYTENQRAGAAANVVVYLPMHPVTGGLHEVFQQVLEGAKLEAEQEGYVLFPKLMPEGAVDLACIERNAQAHDTDAAIMFYTAPEPEVAEHFTRHGSLVLVNTVDMSMQFDSVIANNYAGARLVTQRIIANGHRRLLFVTGDLRFPWRERMRGFMDAVEEAEGVTGDVLEIGYDRFETALAYFGKVFAQKEAFPYSAVFCVNDLTAVGVMQAASEEGLVVPADLSVVGYEDMTFAEMTTPRLTTVHVDRYTIGRESIRLLKRRMSEQHAIPLQIQCGVRFIEGATLGRTTPAR